MPTEVWIAGFPSGYGGADTELDHQIDLFRTFDAEVHLVPMFSASPAMVASVKARGCHIHEYRDDIFKDRIVLSWCNGNFLERLPRIIYRGRPKRTVWLNCMTWLFDREREAHDRGWIDYFGFLSEFQRRILTRALEPIREVAAFDYKPYFNGDRVPWRYAGWTDVYRVGRCSRDDRHKFADDTWRVFGGVETPAGVAKEVCVLGFGPNAADRIGLPPAELRCVLWKPNEIPADEFFRRTNTMIHKTGGCGESYCRVLIEAYAYGVVPIVEDAFAFPELVIHGETGFRSNDSRAMAEYATRLAFRPDEHRRMAENGRAHLQSLSNATSCWNGWKSLLE